MAIKIQKISPEKDHQFDNDTDNTSILMFHLWRYFVNTMYCLNGLLTIGCVTFLTVMYVKLPSSSSHVMPRIINLFFQYKTFQVSSLVAMISLCIFLFFIGMRLIISGIKSERT